MKFNKEKFKYDWTVINDGMLGFNLFIMIVLAFGGFGSVLLGIQAFITGQMNLAMFWTFSSVFFLVILVYAVIKFIIDYSDTFDGTKGDK